MRRVLFIVMLFAMTMSICPLFAAGFSIDAQTDKDTVRFGESLRLVLTLSQDYGSGAIGRMPTIGNIPNFDIAGTSQSQSTQIINGVGRIQLTTTYELVPQKEGDFVIPAFTFQDPTTGTSASSKPIKIKVMPPSSVSAEETEDDDTSSVSLPEAKASNSMFKAILMMALILFLFIALPFIYFGWKSRSVKKNTIWEKETQTVGETKTEKPQEIQQKIVISKADIRKSEEIRAGNSNSVPDKPMIKVKRREENAKKIEKKEVKNSEYAYKDSSYSGDKKMSADNPQLQKSIDKAGETLNKVRKEVKKVLVGQDDLLEFLILALVADGHILLEGVPGLAKTLAIKALARTVRTDFSRIQFTPDLLPADLIGTRIFNQKTTEFQTHKGPIFSNFVLADEINRAPAKVQSALLESMEERQVTIEHETFKLAEPFLVLATQNPIETEGTYTLSEAQVDRFLFKVIVKYPSFDEERVIVKRMGLAEKSHQVGVVEPVLEASDIVELRGLANEVYVDDKIVDYILRIVDATRNPTAYNLDLANYIRFGASPRASIYLTRAARAHAMIAGRTFVKPDDVKAVMTEVLRHRVIPTYEAEADEVDSDAIVETIKEGVAV